MSHLRMLSLQHDCEKIRSVLGFFVLLALCTSCIFPISVVLHTVCMILSQCRHSGLTNGTGLPAVTFLYLCYKSKCWPISSPETETMAVLCLAKDTQFMRVLITEVNYIKTLYYMQYFDKFVLGLRWHKLLPWQFTDYSKLMYSLIRSPLIKDSGYFVENVNIYSRVFTEFSYHHASSAEVI